MLHGQIKKGRILTLETGGLLQAFRAPRVDGDIKVEVVSVNEKDITVKAVNFAYRNQCVHADRLKPVGNIFKIGDRVQCIDGDGDIYTGATGTVLDNDTYPAVAWDTEQISTYKEGDNKYVMSIDEVNLVHSNTVAPVPEPSYSVKDVEIVDEGEPSLSKSEWLEAVKKLASISPENASLTISFTSANKI